MQNKKISEYVLISVPVEDVLNSGIELDGIMQIQVENGRIIIENADKTDFICDRDCESCPINETECDGNCDYCPCQKICEESEVE